MPQAPHSGKAGPGVGVGRVFAGPELAFLNQAVFAVGKGKATTSKGKGKTTKGKLVSGAGRSWSILSSSAPMLLEPRELAGGGRVRSKVERGITA